MSWMSDQRMNCQNCNSLRVDADVFCKLVGAVESLQSVLSSIQPVINSIQPIINSIQPFINSIQPILNSVQSSSSGSDVTIVKPGDGSGSDTEEKDNTEDDTKDDSKITTRICPHPNCAGKTQSYTNGSSLTRHFNTRESLTYH